MDFGILYVPNKAASQAAMGLGCFVFIFCILIPYIVCWAFVPLYLILLIMGAVRRFKVDDPAFTFLFPLAPFLAACALCLPLWWAIPFVVNTADMLLESFRDIFVSNDNISIARKDIPDDKCFLYFIGVIGGCVGSLFSVVSIGSLLDVNKCHHPLTNRHKQFNNWDNYLGNTKQKWGNSDFYKSIQPIINRYRFGSLSLKQANGLILKASKGWCKKNGLRDRVNKLYEENKIPSKPQEIKQAQRTSLSQRQAAWQSCASNIGQIVQPFRWHYKQGKYTADIANDLIKTAINIWAHDNYYSQQAANEIYERLKVKN